MQDQSRRFLLTIRHNSMHSLSWWTDVITQLVNDFQQIVGGECIVDKEVIIDANSPAFRVWIWSDPKNQSLLSTSWSGVMSGGLVDDKFSVTVDVFMFNPKGKSRLFAADGRSFIRLLYDAIIGEWKFNGWMKDEWGEWEGVEYLDAE